VNTATPHPSVAAAVRAAGVSPDAYGPTLNTGTAPQAVETIGRALAEELRAHRLDAVAVWDGSDDAVLAHVVARQLDAVVLRASEEEGVVFFTSDVHDGDRIALLATAWERPRRLATLHALAGNHHLEVVAVASVFAPPSGAEPTELPTLFLAPAGDQPGSTEASER
jgi:NAD(P)-dependent dehydrogenase (short-subunit alcohol dehydrogenase family)